MGEVDPRSSRAQGPLGHRPVARLAGEGRVEDAVIRDGKPAGRLRVVGRVAGPAHEHLRIIGRVEEPAVAVPEMIDRNVYQLPDPLEPARIARRREQRDDGCGDPPGSVGEPNVGINKVTGDEIRMATCRYHYEQNDPDSGSQNPHNASRTRSSVGMTH